MPVLMPDHLAFSGQFELDRPLEPNHLAYLKRFQAIRHVIWDTEKIQYLSDPLREAVGLPIGEQGMYFVASLTDQEKVEQHPYIIDGSPLTHYYIEASLSPDGDRSRLVLLVPGYWCHWIPNAQGTALVWDGEEEFYVFVDWLTFLIEHFLKPWGYSLTGMVTYRDNQYGIDNVSGPIVVSNNKVSWEEQHEEEEEKQERTPAENIELAEYALHRLSEEWLQNDLGEDVTDVLCDALNEYIEHQEEISEHDTTPHE